LTGVEGSVGSARASSSPSPDRTAAEAASCASPAAAPCDTAAAIRRFFVDAMTPTTAARAAGEGEGEAPPPPRSRRLLLLLLLLLLRAPAAVWGVVDVDGSSILPACGWCRCALDKLRQAQPKAAAAAKVLVCTHEGRWRSLAKQRERWMGGPSIQSVRTIHPTAASHTYDSIHHRTTTHRHTQALHCSGSFCHAGSKEQEYPSSSSSSRKIVDRIKSSYLPSSSRTISRPARGPETQQEQQQQHHQKCG
jgi:hypothetical protein